MQHEYKFRRSSLLYRTMVSSTIDQTRPVELKCSVQNYDWGIKGQESLVGAIYGMNSETKIDGDKPYAEVNSVNIPEAFTFTF